MRSRASESDLSFARREQVLLRFEVAWEAGRPLEIDGLLTAVESADDRGPLLLELAHIDLEWRIKAGQGVRAESYFFRFPELAQDKESALGLVVAEFSLRRRTQRGLTSAEYVARFPMWREELQDRLDALDTVGVGRTVPAVQSPPTEPLVALTVIAGPHAGRVFHFREHNTFIVGRSPEAHFSLPERDPYFSRNHFLIEANPPLCRLLDLKSHNGTLVNGKQVAEVDLHDGDVIEAGTTKLSVRTRGCESPNQTWSLPLSTRADMRLPDGLDADLASHQREAWAQGQKWRVADYLRRRPELATRDELLLNLVAGEYLLRRAAGEAVEIGEYLRQFPNLAGALELVVESSGDAALNTLAPAMPRVPGYRLESVLGRGGMGVVYRAVREADGCTVALKMLLPGPMRDDVAVERFLREVKILGRLRHANLVGLREAGEVDGRCFFAMDYIEGGNAAELVKQLGALPMKRAVGIVLQALAGLVYAHEQGFVHRDIKPANILISTVSGADRAFLGDFGLARAYIETSLGGLTMSGDSAGTPQFMPPEQITSFRTAEPAADQYSTAATLYFLLCGQGPHVVGRRLAELYKRILQDKPTPLGVHRPDLPAPLAAVIQRALQREPRQRFGSAAEFAKALQAFAE